MRGGFNELPQDNPGPGTYKTLQAESPRSKSLEAGFAFPLGPKDSTLANVLKNQNPGPGSHDIPPLDPGL